MPLRIRGHISYPKVARPAPVRRGCIDGIEWTEARKDYLRKHYNTTPIADIARVLGTTPRAVRTQANKMGIRRYSIPIVRAA